MQLLNIISSFFISNAYADTVAPAVSPQQNAMSFIPMIAILIFFMYFVVWRPQSKRMKEQKSLLGSLAVGDEVLTAGGMLGTIHKLADSYIVLTIADNVHIKLQKTSVVAALPKGTLQSI